MRVVPTIWKSVWSRVSNPVGDLVEGTLSHDRVLLPHWVRVRTRVADQIYQAVEVVDE